MSYRLPAPLRQKYSTEGQFNNPAATAPMPPPTNMPVACWFQDQISLRFAASAEYFREVSWSSPIFDLRPELRGMPSGFNAVGGGRTAPNAVPIWGSGALHVQINNLTNTPQSLTNVGLFGFESGHLSDPGRLRQILPSNDLTQYIQCGTPSVILSFDPPGEGHVVRYWRIRLRFIITEDTGLNPPLYSIDSAYY